jgi:hypothetical protein
MPSRPQGGGTSTSQGGPYGIFQRAVTRRNLPAGEAAAKALPQISLADALEFTFLFARKDQRRHGRVAARSLLRFLEGTLTPRSKTLR